MKHFKARLQPVPHGGQFVVVPAEIAAAAGLVYGARVRGKVNGVPYRSSLMKYSGVFHMGVHKATLAAARARPGAEVDVTIARDDEPLPTDVVPDDLARALARHAGVRAAWNELAPSRRRVHVKEVLDAKKDETRSRRIVRIVETLRSSAHARSRPA